MTKVKSWQVECANERLGELEKVFSKMGAFHVIVKRGETSTTLVVWEPHFYGVIMSLATSADERGVTL